MSDPAPPHYSMTLYWPDSPDIVDKERARKATMVIGALYGEKIVSINGKQLGEPLMLLGVSIHTGECPQVDCGECGGSGLVDPLDADEVDGEVLS